MKKIALIGGGATNLLLAALLSIKEDIQVDIIEIRDRVGKKILETGNGKCNFSNKYISKGDYNNEKFVKNIIKHNVVETFHNLGLLYYYDNEGRYYPCSDASNSILDLLRSKYINNKCFKELTNSHVYKITKDADGYLLKVNNENNYYDYVVMAIGSKVNNNSFKKINLDLKINDYSPSLCPLNININGLKGVRVKGRIKLFDSDKLIYEENGEVIFKDNAISGISIFNISFFLNKEKINNPNLSIDLFPSLSNKELLEFLLSKENQESSIFFIGLVNKMIGQNIIKRLDLKGKITKDKIEKIAELLKNFNFKINGLVDAPQVAKGGIDVKEISSNLELKKYQNIYIGGEMIDIDGKCGGFNLHFAFASAIEIYKELKGKL